jgi:hypothetical protein
MPKYMKPDTALARLVEDDGAPVGLRVRALRALNHPTLVLLRRLLVDTATRTVPVPSRLKAIAALKFASEVEFRKVRARKGGPDGRRNGRPNGRRQESAANPLGIS